MLGRAFGDDMLDLVPDLLQVGTKLTMLPLEVSRALEEVFLRQGTILGHRRDHDLRLRRVLIEVDRAPTTSARPNSALPQLSAAIVRRPASSFSPSVLHSGQRFQISPSPLQTPSNEGVFALPL